MNTAHCTNMTRSDGNHRLPTGFLSGFILFGALWLLLVVTLIAIASISS